VPLSAAVQEEQSTDLYEERGFGKASTVEPEAGAEGFAEQFGVFLGEQRSCFGGFGESGRFGTDIPCGTVASSGESESKDGGALSSGAWRLEHQ